MYPFGIMAAETVSYAGKIVWRLDFFIVRSECFNTPFSLVSSV